MTDRHTDRPPDQGEVPLCYLPTLTQNINGR
jgi:hypothetical protein